MCREVLWVFCVVAKAVGVILLQQPALFDLCPAFLPPGYAGAAECGGSDQLQRRMVLPGEGQADTDEGVWWRLCHSLDHRVVVMELAATVDHT